LIQTIGIDTYSLIFGFAFRKYSAFNVEGFPEFAQTIQLPFLKSESSGYFGSSYTYIAVGGEWGVGA
jgi:hypothetical protein